MIKLSVSTVIDRPIEEVFAYVSDIGHDVEWGSGVVEVRKTSEGPWGLGTRYVYVRHVLGRRIEAPGEITAFEPPHRYAFRAESGPVQASGATDLEPAEGGTRLTFSMEAEPGGLFKLAEPLLGNQLRRQMEFELGTLKALLEARGGAGEATP